VVLRIHTMGLSRTNNRNTNGTVVRCLIWNVWISTVVAFTPPAAFRTSNVQNRPYRPYTTDVLSMADSTDRGKGFGPSKSRTPNDSVNSSSSTDKSGTEPREHVKRDGLNFPLPDPNASNEAPKIRLAKDMTEEEKADIQSKYQNLFIDPSIPDPSPPKVEDINPDELFQILLNDIICDGDPVFEIDVSTRATLSAAMWTVLCDFSERDAGEKLDDYDSGGMKSAVVLEGMAIEDLRVWATEFYVDKQGLTELPRLSVALLGDGAGPALVITATDRTPEEITAKPLDSDPRLLNQQTEAMKQFTYRMAVVDPPEEGTGMADNFNVLPLAPTNFPVCNSADVCVMMATFWNCVLVLRQTPHWELEGTVLALPGCGSDLERFDAVMNLMRKNLENYSDDTDEKLELVNYHPHYGSSITTTDTPTEIRPGYLPPRSWMKPMMRMSRNIDIVKRAASITEEELELVDYQRKSPVPMVHIRRQATTNKAPAFPDGTPPAVTTTTEVKKDLELVHVSLDDGEVISMSRGDLEEYVKNAVTLIAVGKTELALALDIEMG